MFHHDEAPELLDESAEQFLDCADESMWDTEDWADDSANAPDIPSILIKPFSETEPVCDASELEAIDAAADSFELDRLTKAGVLEQSESWLEGHRTLSSKYVRTWRPKVIKGERVWLRRARLVAREFAHLGPGRQHLFAPTTTQCMLRIVPSLFIRNFGDGWSLLSLDVSDAFLQCKQQHDTLTKVDGKWYKLFRMLPGQRDGSATWFQDFMCEIRAAVAAEPLAEQPVLFRIPHAEGSHMLPDPGDGELEDRESESEAEEAPTSAGALRNRRYRAKCRNASRAEVLFLYVKTCGDESESLGTAAAGNYLLCVAELGEKCIKPLGAQEHLQQQDTWRARHQKRRDRDFAAKQMSLQNQTTRNQMFKCCLKSLFRFRAAVQLGPAQAAVAGALCRAPAAANQGAVTPVPAMPALAGRLAVLPAGQAQWVFQAAAPSVIFEAVADRQGLYTCFADGQAAEPEVGTARRYLGRPFWMVRLPPTVMKHLMEIGKEFVVPGGLVTSLGHQLPGTVPAAAEGSPSDGADSGSSSSCEMKKVRRPAMQEILLGKLAYKLSSTVGIQDVVRTVLRMLVPDSLGLQTT
ncbi:unnamed protein product [Symbiodinium sp. CCMP2592]|nr:unnamed protein product [Symbiodinium sp. CCMP2592]